MMTTDRQNRPWWHPEVYAQDSTARAARIAVRSAVRRFFEQRGYTEVETPILQLCPGMEPHLGVFRTILEDPDRGSLPRLLHTSPEFTMKKLLVAGESRIFQIAKVFRNGERSATHHPEFSMLEWYRVGATLSDLMDETEALCRAAAQATTGAEQFRWDGRQIDLARPFVRLSVAEAFQRHTGLDILAGFTAELGPGEEPDPAPLRQAALAAGLLPSGSNAAEDRWEDLFFRLMLNRVEPALAVLDQPVFLYDWPAPLAALARRNPVDPRVAERFELYAGGLELANAFRELTDAAEQRARFEADAALRQALYGDPLPMDEEFLAALAHGLPDCAGIALGFDRLVMACSGAAEIEAVLWAPTN